MEHVNMSVGSVFHPLLWFHCASVFEPPFWALRGNVCTPSMAHAKPVVDFIFVVPVIELFSLSPTVETLWAEIGRIWHFSKGSGSLWVQRPIFSFFEYNSTADRLKCCQLSSPASVINIWWLAAMLFVHHRRDLYSAARPSRRNYLITIWCGAVTSCRDTCGNWESLRDWLSVPLFTRAFLKSQSSRGFSAIAELLVRVSR